MEFTISGRIRRRGRRLIGWSAPGVLGTAAWAAAADGGSARRGALALLVLCTGLLLRGVLELRRLRRPFRLVMDDTGITLHDARLPWGAVESIALRHPPRSAEDGAFDPAPPRLVLRLARGAELPRGRERGAADPREHTLLDCTDLDQPRAELVGALREFAGHRFETSPRHLLPPIPRDARSPELGGAERQFTAHRNSRAVRLAVTATAAAICAVPPAGAVALGRALGSAPLALLGLPFAAPLCWASVRMVRRQVRPLRLRIGPEGIGLREPAEPEVFVRWSEIGAVATGRLPHTVEAHPHLVVYAAPGSVLPFPRGFVDRGHLGYVLLRLDQLPDRGRGLPDALRAFVPDRWADLG
ncbi:hypothetical protein GCM10009759_72170 [Kitasatospora saccharophila]|uniref:PH (Pleckstrin Homology) domain-containing protein n=1 Tax=Kitasatospora saccharophila TaxID=407973 RepID=A0ABN2Y5G8_9ACTN